jgi:hypothetical protein
MPANQIAQTVNVYVNANDLDQMSKVVKMFDRFAQVNNAGAVRI